MQVHQIKRNPALQVPMDPRNRHPASHIHNLEVRQMRLRYRFVHLFVFAYAPEEIPLGYFGRGIFVIGVPGADFECDVSSNDGWVVADGFEEDEMDAFLFRDAGFDAGSAFNMLAGIRSQYKIAPPSSASTIRRICTHRQKKSFNGQKTKIPWIPTFPPSFNHRISISRLS